MPLASMAEGSVEEAKSLISEMCRLFYNQVEHLATLWHSGPSLICVAISKSAAIA